MYDGKLNNNNTSETCSYVDENITKLSTNFKPGKGIHSTLT